MKDLRLKLPNLLLVFCRCHGLLRLVPTLASRMESSLVSDTTGSSLLVFIHPMLAEFLLKLPDYFKGHIKYAVLFAFGTE